MKQKEIESSLQIKEYQIKADIKADIQIKNIQIKEDEGEFPMAEHQQP
jgi:hypothetical protein